MHILMMIIGVLSTIGVIIWRIQMATHAAKEIGDFAKGAANLPRKLAFRRKTGKAGSDLVTDPREAAVVLMLEMARANGEVTADQKAAIQDIICDQFGFSSDEAEEVLVKASWVSAPEAGTDKLVRRMIKLICANVTHEEVVELDGMLERISEVDGLPSSAQLDVLQAFRRQTGVMT